MTTIVHSNVQPRETPAARAPFFTATRIKTILVVVTLIALIAGVVLQNAGASSTLWLPCFWIAYAAGGWYGARGAIRQLREGKIDIDLLMILAAIGAALIGQWYEGALLLFLFSLSNALQDYALDKSRRAVQSLMRLYPDHAMVERDGAYVTVPIDAIRAGDRVRIHPGERIPIDGVVIDGSSFVNQAPITGESMPVEKSVGAKVFAGTLNERGALDITASGTAGETVLRRIVQMVEQAQENRAPIQHALERFEGRYSIGVLVVIGLLIVVPPFLLNADFGASFYRAIVLMTVLTPCALVISTPAVFLSAIAAAARSGVLFKGGAYLSALANVKWIAFDKTGTLTEGKPTVTDLLTSDGVSEADALTLAASIEARSEHPLAAAILAAAAARSLTVIEVNDFEAIAGRGASATVNGVRITVGSPAYAGVDLPSVFTEAIARWQDNGKTAIIVRRDDQPIAAIALADPPRAEAKAAIAALRDLGIGAAMLSGDNARAAGRVARELGIDRVFADLLPADKVTAIEALKREFGAVAMIGDGVNDAPALASASIGMAMGAAGTDVALETADVVLMGDRLAMIPAAVRLSRKARRVLWQNWALAITVIVVLAISTFAVSLALPIGVLGHEGSTVIVILNALVQLLILPEIARRRTG